MTRNRVTTDQVHSELRAHSVEPAFDAYTGPRQPLAFLCSCPERRPGAITFRALHYQGVLPLCPVCRRIAQQDRMRANRQDRAPASPAKADTDVGSRDSRQRVRTADRVAALFAAQGTRPLDAYVNQATPMRFVCAGPCGGNTHEITWAALRAGQIPRCPACRDAARPRGETHHRWNADLTDAQRNRIRNAADRRWEQAVLRAHNHSCVITGRRGAAPHHLFDHSSHPELRLLFQNGVCLTRRLHREFHDAYGYGGNTHAQFVTFYEAHTGRTCPIPDPLDLDLDPGTWEFVA